MLLPLLRLPRALSGLVAMIAALLPVAPARAQTGACCIGTSCTLRTLSFCESLGGEFFGGSCTPNLCGGASLGACCNTATLQCTVTAPSGCTGGSQAFLGLGTNCVPTNPCLSRGGCCDATTFTCTLTTGAACGTGKSFLGAGIGCAASNPCASLGACCDDTDFFGSCRISSPAACPAGSLTTVFQGAGTTCTPSRCSGACCTNRDADCFLRSHNSCSLFGSSTYFGDGTVCLPNPCPAFSGACCDPSSVGNCVITLPEGCPASIFRGVGTTCSPNFCVAACCIDGECVVVRQSDCVAGTPMAEGTTCSPCNDCLQSDPIGACCRSSTCTVERQSCCAGGANYRGVGTPCGPVTCVGACCDGASCTLTVPAGCTGSASFRGLDTPCEAPAGNPTACCPANFNGSGGLSVQDIFDFLAAYFAGQFTADFNHSMTLTVQDIFDFLAAYFSGC